MIAAALLALLQAGPDPAIAALLDATLAIAIAAAVLALSRGRLWAGGAVVLLCYYAGTTAWTGRGLGARWRVQRASTSPAAPAAAPRRGQRHDRTLVRIRIVR